MKVIETTKLTAFDVDETLIISVPRVQEAQMDPDCFLYNGTWWRPHFRHIHQLKSHKARGHTIFVWSAGGCSWAQKVVKHLKLEEYVDYVMDKPLWCYDDNEQWINLIYYQPYDMKEHWEVE